MMVSPVAAIEFEDVSASAGIDYLGASFGSSWGDYNGDGWPDLWASSHADVPRLYINNRDGTFSSVPGLDVYKSDNHGAAWADFDNDGDLDLLQLDGGQAGYGEDANSFLVNTGAGFVEQAVQRGLDNPLGRARTPLWLDWDDDGDLDVLISAHPRSDGQAPTAVFTQQDGFFTEEGPSIGFATARANGFSQLGWHDGYDEPVVMIHAGVYHDGIYRYGPEGFVSATYDLNSITNTSDAVLADLNGDTVMDIFLTRTVDEAALIIDDGGYSGKMRLYASSNEVGIKFSGPSELAIEVAPTWKVRTDQIYIGEQGINPPGTTFSVSASSPDARGIKPHFRGLSRGIYVGFNEVENSWQLLMNTKNPWYMNFALQSDEPIIIEETIAFEPSNGAKRQKYFMGTGFSAEDVSDSAGFGQDSSCQSVVTADFDNDMDLDLYLACHSVVGNSPNLLYENQGGGVFHLVADAGGAAGGAIGKAESVSAADFDRDGFIDLFVANGEGNPPFNEGPYRLFRNKGNANHWIELDLEGVESNRDAIGSRLLLRAGGIEQVQLQDGGMHRFVQDHARIHFGLERNDRVEELVIQWPGGIEQTIQDLPADQVVHVLEPSFPSVKGRPSFYVRGEQEGVFVWKESFDGPYQIRINGDGPLQTYTINLVASSDIANITPDGLESNDKLEVGTNWMTLLSRVTTSDDALAVRLDPPARASISVSNSEQANPRQLHFGADGRHPSPQGWTFIPGDLPALPGFIPGENLGLFVGWDGLASTLQARWNGDGKRHLMEVDILSAQVLDSVAPVSYEPNDQLAIEGKALSASGTVSNWWDGIDLALNGAKPLALLYKQDGLHQPRSVNYGAWGQPDTYRIPRAEPYGEPAYDANSEAGLFVWMDTDGFWHVRGAAGGGMARYRGEVACSQPLMSLVGINLEASDVVDNSDATRITFDMQMKGPWADGFKFQAPEGATLTINLESGPDLLYVGEKRWPVDTVPLDLSGW